MVHSITMLMIRLVLRLLKKAVMQDKKALPRARDVQAARWEVLKKAVMQDRKALPRARDVQAARWEVLKMSKKFLYW